MIIGIKRWRHFRKVRRFFERFLGLTAFLLNGLCVFEFLQLQGGAVKYILVYELLVAQAVAFFGIFLNWKSILSWIGLVLGGLIVLLLMLGAILMRIDPGF